MGTRSKTFVVEGLEKVEVKDYSNCIAMYRQYDGYPDGHGLELAQFLKPFTIVNGISMNETRQIANGLDCLAAQMVKYFKDGVGGIYLSATAWTGGLDYYYVVYYNNSLMMQCWDAYEGKLIFDGTPEEFIQKYSKV